MADPLYREILMRDNWSDEWEEPARSRTLCMGLQNPSTADQFLNDPTVVRSMGFAQRLGFGRLIMTNTYLRRFTDPRELYRWLGTLTLAERDRERSRAAEIMCREARAADLFIAGWGNGHRNDEHWPSQLADILAMEGVKVCCLGLNKNGTPKHPLARGRNRISDDQQPILWRAPPRGLTLHG